MPARTWLVLGCCVLTALAGSAQERPEASADTIEKIDPDLHTAAAAAAPDAELDLVVWLDGSPAPRIAREVRAAHRADLDAATRELRRVHSLLRPAEPLPRDAERIWIESLRTGKSVLRDTDRAQISSLSAEIETRSAALRRDVSRRLAKALGPRQKALADAVARLGGTVVAPLSTVNAAVVRLPASRLDELGALPGVGRVDAVPPGEPELDAQESSLGLTDGFWSEGLDGGPWDVGILDTGVQQDHPALAGVAFESRAGTSDSHGHGTGVAGIVASGDASFRGVAFGLERVVVGRADQGYVLADAEWMAATVADAPEAINLSWGYGAATGDDSAFDRYWDALVDTHGILVAKSAGNGGPALGTLSQPAAAHNVVSVVNVYDQGTVSRDDDRIWVTSSRGPTAAGRKKPDLAAPGQDTRTTWAQWNQGDAFFDLGGTSAAAPHVAGAALLLAHLQGGADALAAKAVLINTADTWSDGGTPDDAGDDGPAGGSQWNPTYGWGYLDLWEAWLNGLDVAVTELGDGRDPAVPTRRFFAGELFAGEKATLVWNRHVGWAGASAPATAETLSDLDLALYDAATGTRIARSASRIDNVEQVAAVADRRVVLAVEAVGAFDPDVDVETFALAFEEAFAEVAPPRLVSPSRQLEVDRGETFPLAVTVRNTGGLDAFGVTVALGALPDGWQLAGGDATQRVGRVAAGASATVTWNVRAPDADRAATLRWTVAGEGWGAALAAASDAKVSVGSGKAGIFAASFEDGLPGGWSDVTP